MENNIVNILMVDDRPENLLALEAVLTSPNYRLVKANSGMEALKYVLREEFAVILMDVQMPHLNGFETAKLIRERKKSKEVPIIFITALSQTIENVLHGYSVGAIDYILKPFDPIIIKCKVEGFVSLYLHKKKIIEQNELIARKSKELEMVHSELRKKEAMSRAIGETSIDTIVSIDEKGTILTVNPAAKEMFGYTKFDLVGKKVDILFDFSISDIPKQAIVESIGIRKDQSTFPIEVHLADMRLEYEKIYVCSIRDITERKEYFDRLERLVEERTNELKNVNESLKFEIDEKQATLHQLFESEEKYRLLVEESPEAIIVRALSSEKISFINETGAKLLKAKSKADIIGKNIYDIIHPEDHARVREFNIILEKGQSVNTYEERLVCLNGDIINVQVKIIPFVYEAEASLHIVIRDITELKRSKEFIQQSEKLSMVGELAAGIAHEIRNPLTSLKGFTQLLEYKFTTESDYVDIMISEIDRINTIVSELLLLSKPSRDDFNIVNLEEVLCNVITLMCAQANLHGIVINRKDDVDLRHIYFQGVENKIKQVFINIIKNAIEAMDKDGSITINTSKTRNKIIISFKDDGCGIPVNILQNIGKPFYTTKEKGTGLGLMVSYSIIESHQGEMRIDSVEGEGTIVEISLPLINEEQLLTGIQEAIL